MLNRLDPMTYAVDPIRKLVFIHLDLDQDALRALDPGVTWFGWHVPALVEVALVVAFGLVLLGIAIWQFSATE